MMGGVMEQLALAFDAYTSAWRSPFRSEERRDEVRIVEYSAFPRVTADQVARVGFTRDLSPSGLCIGSDRPELHGAWLRVAMRDEAGRSEAAFIARVVWCEPAGDGRHWIGLERIGDGGDR